MTTAHASLAEHAARLAAQADQVVLCLDFDGTLSPIVDDPEAARPLPGLVELLGPLAARFAAVALISGRPADYLSSTPTRPACATWGCTACRRSTTARFRSTHAWRRPARPCWPPPPGPAGQRRHPRQRCLAGGQALRGGRAHPPGRRPDRWAEPIDQTARQIAALGFGAQQVVRDLLAGIFIVAERQYGYGDMVHISAVGFEGATGTIEEVALRTTRLRTLNGEVVIVPNGLIVGVTNLSRDWARAVVDVPLPAGVDVVRANELLRKVGADAFQGRGVAAAAARPTDRDGRGELRGRPGEPPHGGSGPCPASSSRWPVSCGSG
jgi:hypothetical protein